MAVIEIDKSALTSYIASHCPNYFYNFQDGECCMKKVSKDSCDLHIFAKELNCPPSCPRITTKEYSCDKGRCIHVRATIRKLKEGKL